MKYRRKPQVVDAVEFNGLNHDEIACFCEPTPVKVGGNHTLLIPSPEGEMTVRKGEWVIRDGDGDFYRETPEKFEATYGAVWETYLPDLKVT